MNSPRTISIAGNCQVWPLADWLQKSLPECQITILEPYHQLTNNEQVEKWLHSCQEAEYVLAIPVKDGYLQLPSLGTEQWKTRLEAKLFLYPNLHSDAFFPFFGYVRDSEGKTITHTDYPSSPYGDYHDFLAMALAASPIPWGRIQRLRLGLASILQTKVIATSAKRSTSELSRRLVAMQSSLAGEQLPLASLCGFTFNHPTSQLLNTLYRSLWLKVLNLPLNEFVPLNHEPFEKGSHLPVYDSVVSSLRAIQPDLSHACFPRHIESDGEYEEKLKRSMRFYASNPSIIDTNLNHPKLLMARRYLRLVLG